MALVAARVCIAAAVLWCAVFATVTRAANAVFGTAVGFLIYFRLTRILGSMRTASVSYLKTGVGVLIGCIALGEPFSWALFMSLAAIVIGVVAINSPAGSSVCPKPNLTSAIPKQLTAAPAN
jgi:hypothetical protein